MVDKIIQQIKIPINYFLYGREELLKEYNLPLLTKKDYQIIFDLKKSINVPVKEKNEMDNNSIITDLNYSIKLAKSVSFYEYLKEKMIYESKEYAKSGIKNFVISVCDFPCCENGMENISYFILRLISLELKNMCAPYSDFSVGIMLPKNCNEYSIDIACRNELDFIVCEDFSGENYLKKNELSFKLKHKNPEIYLSKECANDVFEDGCYYDINKLYYLAKREMYSLTIPLFENYNKKIICISDMMEFRKENLTKNMIEKTKYFLFTVDDFIFDIVKIKEIIEVLNKVSKI